MTDMNREEQQAFEMIKADANFETGLVTVESENGIALETLKDLVESLGFDFLGE